MSKHCLSVAQQQYSGPRGKPLCEHWDWMQGANSVQRDNLWAAINYAVRVTLILS